MKVTKANLATYLAGLTPSATPYPIEITETVASDWGASGTSGMVGNIINTNTPNGVYLDLGLTVIPNGVNAIVSTFFECRSLTTAPIIPSSVIFLIYTFYSCTALTTVPIIPSSVADMSNTFRNCTSLHTIQNFAVDVDNCDMTYAFYNCPALANIYVTTPTESSWHLLHTDTGATGTDYTIYNPDGTVAGSGTVAGTSQVLTLYGKSDELVISDNITPTLAVETATSQVQWHKSGLPYDDELMIFNAKNPTTVISNFITVNRAGEEFLGNSATATKLAIARKINGVDFDGTADIYDTYSTAEHRIGTWVDGKPLYRKVINFGALPNNTSKNVKHGISDIDKITRLYGIAERSTSGSYPIPYAHPITNNAIQLYGSETIVQITTGYDRTDLTAFVIIEHTKTTD